MHYLIGRNSLDDSLWRKIVNKVSVVSEALEGCKERLNVAKVNGKSKPSKRPKLQTRELDGSDAVEESFEGDEDSSPKVKVSQGRASDDGVISRGDLRSFFQRSSAQKTRKDSSSSTSSQPSEDFAASPPEPSSSVQPLSSKKTQLQRRKSEETHSEDIEWRRDRCTLLNKKLWLRCNACGATRTSF